MNANAIIDLLNEYYSRQKLTPVVASLYKKRLSDIDPNVLHAAAMGHIDASQWMPSVAELRTLSAEIAKQRAATPTPTAFHAKKLRDIRQQIESWPLCKGGCGERVPDPANCPACADVARMKAAEMLSAPTLAEATPA